MNEKRQVASNMVAQTLSFVVSIMVSFFLTSFIVDKIGTSAYGFVGLSNNVTNCIVAFTIAINSLANRYITIAYVEKNYSKANRYYSSAVAANVIVVAAMILPIVFLIIYLEKVVNIPVQHIMDVKMLWAFVFLVYAMQLIFGRMEVATFATNRLDLSAMRNLESNIIKFALSLVLYMMLSPKVYYVGVVALICAVYVILFNKRYMNTLVPDIKFSVKDINKSATFDMISNGMWNSANHISQILFNGLDLLIANLFIGPVGMGILSIAKTIPTHIITFIGTISSVFYPNMTISYAKGNSEDFIKETNFAIKLCGYICSIPIIAIIVYSKAFYGLWLPSLDAIQINEIHLLSVITLIPQLFSVYLFPLYQVNTLTCKLKTPSIVNMVLGFVNIASVFLLLKFTDFGLYAIAGVSSILLGLRVLIFMPLYAASNIKRKLTTFYPPLISGVILNIILVAVFYAINYLVNIDGLISFVITCAVSCILGYIIGVFVIFNKADRMIIIDVMAKKVNSLIKRRK
ncbi:MAG: MATE family efflux transporter [Eubacteriales bacterium]|nr:MATE family efflux transporter [Eubacteriales bacterium]